MRAFKIRTSLILKILFHFRHLSLIRLRSYSTSFDLLSLFYRRQRRIVRPPDRSVRLMALRVYDALIARDRHDVAPRIHAAVGVVALLQQHLQALALALLQLFEGHKLALQAVNVRDTFSLVLRLHTRCSQPPR